MSNPFTAQDVTLHLGDCLSVMPTLEAGSVDAVICDPPYPEIDRPYGRMTEADWHAMMRGVVAESRRVLKPHGSAVFILQPNSERVGRMRPWLWEFMAWTAREWNQIQDVWWWNTSCMPIGGANRHGLMRPSVKAQVWLGNPDCYRNQDAVLLAESDSNKQNRHTQRFADHTCPSRVRTATEGPRDNYARLRTKCVDRGGVTPFNMHPVGSSSSTGGGSYGHSASTPTPLVDWWIRYITKPGDAILDPFIGSGTTAIAALNTGRKCIGIERDPGYHEIACDRVKHVVQSTPLFVRG